MQHGKWIPEINKTLVCIDSYHNGVPAGRFYSSLLEAESFDSLTQFLMKMEQSLDERQTPQAYTSMRSFSDMLDTMETGETRMQARRGQKATFEIMVLFRQHTSWQGLVRWQERKQEQSFRSALELIRLMDSALRSGEGGGAA